MSKIPFTREYLLQFFHYDKDQGVLIWKNHWSKRHQFLIGRVAGCVVKKKTDRTPYIKVSICNKGYQIQDLIWVIENNSIFNVIDHIDGNGLNNRIENLRNVTTRYNQHNTYKNRKGRLPGCTFEKRLNKWRAYLWISGKLKYLGLHLTEQKAHERYMKELKIRGLS